MDANITINGIEYIRKDAIIKKHLSQEDIENYLNECHSHDFVRIAQKVAGIHLSNDYIDDESMTNVGSSLTTKRLLLIKLTEEMGYS